MAKLKDGFFDCTGVIDELISGMNNAVKALFNGQFIAYCDSTRLIAQGLSALKKGVGDELAAKDATIERLKAELRECGREIVEVNPCAGIYEDDEGGDIDGK